MAESRLATRPLGDGDSCIGVLGSLSVVLCESCDVKSADVGSTVGLSVTGVAGADVLGIGVGEKCRIGDVPFMVPCCNVLGGRMHTICQSTQRCVDTHVVDSWRQETSCAEDFFY